MLTPSRRGAADTAPNLSIYTLGVGDHRLRAELRQNRSEVLYVIHLQIDLHLCEIRRTSRHADIIDVAVVLRDHSGDFGEGAWLIHRLHSDAPWETLRIVLVHIPAHIQPALRRVLERFQVGGLDRVNGDPFAWRQNADNAVARYRAAVWGEPNGQFAIDAANRDRRTVVAITRHLE